MPPISIVFTGTPDFAVPSLEALLENPAFQVSLVITQPDRPTGRKQTLTSPPVKVIAQSHGIPVWQPENINAQWDDKPPVPAPDFLVVVAYGQILKSVILEWPAIAPVNVHASLLPRWRGASPIHHAILSRDTETGVTIQRMVEALDAGPILSAERVTIGAEETTPQLHDRLAHMGAQLLIGTLQSPLHETPQDTTHVTVCHKITKAMGEIDPSVQTAQEIERTVRALQPWPGVRYTFDGEECKILEAEASAAADATTENTVVLQCKNNTTLYIRKLQPAGGKPMTAMEWKRGRR